MFIKLYLTNGQTVSAFVDEATVEYLNEVIIEEGCYDDESEITDYDYVDYANLMSGELVFIFDKKYNLDKDVASFEVDRDAMESEEDKEERMAAYRTIYQDAMEYALDFFHGSISKVFENKRDVRPDFLPILFTTEDDRSRTLPKFTFHGNEPAIYINLQKTILDSYMSSIPGERIDGGYITLLIYIISLAAYFVLSVAKTKRINDSSRNVSAVSGSRMFKKMFDQPLKFFEQYSAGELMSRIDNNISLDNTLIRSLVPRAIDAVMTMVYFLRVLNAFDLSIIIHPFLI